MIQSERPGICVYQPVRLQPQADLRPHCRALAKRTQHPILSDFIKKQMVQLCVPITRIQRSFVLFVLCGHKCKAVFAFVHFCRYMWHACRLASYTASPRCAEYPSVLPRSILRLGVPLRSSFVTADGMQPIFRAMARAPGHCFFRTRIAPRSSICRCWTFLRSPSFSILCGLLGAAQSDYFPLVNVVFNSILPPVQSLWIF